MTLVLSSATSFNGFDKSPVREGRDAAALASADLRAALSKPWDDAPPRARRRSSSALRPGLVRADSPPRGQPGGGSADRPADHEAGSRAIRGLVELLFQYGRYLLIASQPARLATREPSRDLERRAPRALELELHDQHQHRDELLAGGAGKPRRSSTSRCSPSSRELAVSGRKTVSTYYGARGWTAHHNSDLWRHSAPVGNFGAGDPVWAFWPMAGAWLSQHLYEHYLFGGDQAFLRDRAYPVMKGAAEFCLDWLVDDGQGTSRDVAVHVAGAQVHHAGWRPRRGVDGVDDGPRADARPVLQSDRRKRSAEHRRRVSGDSSRRRSRACRLIASEARASCSSGFRSSRIPNPIIGTSRICSDCIRAGTSRREHRSSSLRFADRTSCAAMAARDGASPGRSIIGRACSTAIARSRY